MPSGPSHDFSSTRASASFVMRAASNTSSTAVRVREGVRTASLAGQRVNHAPRIQARVHARVTFG